LNDIFDVLADPDSDDMSDSSSDPDSEPNDFLGNMAVIDEDIDGVEVEPVAAVFGGHAVAEDNEDEAAVCVVM